MSVHKLLNLFLRLSTIIYLLIFLSACVDRNKKLNQLENRINHLEQLILKTQNQKSEGIQRIDTIIANEKVHIYKPINAKIVLQHKRPNQSNENLLCVPGAYTSRTNQIDGFYIEKGVVIQSIANNRLNGVCIISDNGIEIIERNGVDPSLKGKIIKEKKGLFQQTLLLLNSTIVKCDLFGNTRSQRRSLAKFNGYDSIVESETALSIYDFQKCLLKMGVVSAVNLDMGSWSEGWYIDSSGQKVEIGDNRINTKRQTNWIVLSRM